MYNHLVLAIGFLGQALFGARMLIQWIQSEREHRVVSSQLFWKTSLLASGLLLMYGVFRHDAVIVIGQFTSYYIYVRNLQLMGHWTLFPATSRATFLLLPFGVIALSTIHNEFRLGFFLEKNALTHWLIVVGWLGQLLLNLRFFYQIYLAERAHESILPTGFWVISLAGSVMILLYALYRTDLVLLVGQMVGIVVYTRNILIAGTTGNITPK